MHVSTEPLQVPSFTSAVSAFQRAHVAAASRSPGLVPPDPELPPLALTPPLLAPAALAPPWGAFVPPSLGLPAVPWLPPFDVLPPVALPALVFEPPLPALWPAAPPEPEFSDSEQAGNHAPPSAHPSETTQIFEEGTRKLRAFILIKCRTQ
jgi:hypothetical protein